MTEPPRRRWRRVVAAVLAVCSVSYVLLFVQLGTWPGGRHARHAQHAQHHSQPGDDTYTAPNGHNALFENLALTDAQCRATFPGLMDPIDSQVRRGPFDLQPASDLGPLQARVRDGQLWVVATEAAGILPPELLDARAAALNQINRALLTAPLPTDDVLDTVFSVNIQDQPFGSAWTYSLPAYAAPTAGNAPIGRSFLMPHFSFWAWRPRMVGSFARAAAAVAAVEASLSFSAKQPRAVWRGTTRFTGAHHPQLRQQLLNATRGAQAQAWADVQALDWLPETDSVTKAVNRAAMQEASNALMIEDFCRYKYVVHTEGITYSGRFQFHQLCRSVVLTPPIAWLQHTTHLVKPLYASDLDFDVGEEEDDAKTWKPTADEEQAWPHATPDEANLVFVSPDWSNLGATVRWLERHPAVAEGIAARQRALFADRGYLSPAAEACYWRALLRGWRQVVRYNDSAVAEGVPWELFALAPRVG